MVTVNIDGAYSISGTNKGVLYGLSTEREATLNDPNIRPKLKNGFEYREMDTQKTYLYDEASNRWRYWKTEGDGGGGGGGGDITFATNAEAQSVLDSAFKNRNGGA